MIKDESSVTLKSIEIAFANKETICRIGIDDKGTPVMEPIAMTGVPTIPAARVKRAPDRCPRPVYFKVCFSIHKLSYVLPVYLVLSTSITTNADVIDIIITSILHMNFIQQRSHKSTDVRTNPNFLWPSDRPHLSHW